MSLPRVEIVGTVTNEPELRHTPRGYAVATIRVATNERIFDRQTEEWRNARTTYINLTAWRHLAEQAMDRVRKGDHVIAIGRLVANEVERDGRTVTYYEVEVDALGPSLPAWQSASDAAAAPEPDPWG